MTAITAMMAIMAFTLTISTLYAQDFLDSFNEELAVKEIEQKAQDDNLALEKEKSLDQSDFSTINKLKKFYGEKNILKIRNRSKKKEVHHKGLRKPRIIQGILRKGSTLHFLKKNKETNKSIRPPIIIPRSILVNVRARVNKYKMVQLVGKSGKLIFQTKVANINSIQNDLELPPEMGIHSYPYKKWPPKDRSHTLDYHYTLNFLLKIHKESFRSRYIDQLKNAATGDTVTTANRFEMKGFYDSPHKFDFGINFSLQQGKWSNNDDLLNWNASYIGPVLNWNIVKSQEVTMQVQISYQYALSFTATDEDNDLSFSANVFQLDIEGLLPTPIGQLAGGVTFRTYKLSPTSSTRIRPITKDSFWSIGLNIGIGLDFTI